MLKRIDNQNIFNFKIITMDKNYNEYTIVSNRNFKWIINNDLNKIEDIYYHTKNSKVIYIKFKGDNVLKRHKIIRLETF